VGGWAGGGGRCGAGVGGGGAEEGGGGGREDGGGGGGGGGERGGAGKKGSLSPDAALARTVSVPQSLPCVQVIRLVELGCDDGGCPN